MAGVTHSQRVDREQVESDWWFGRMRGRLLQFLEWADLPDEPIRYELTAKAKVEVIAGGYQMVGLEDFLDLVDD